MSALEREAACSELERSFARATSERGLSTRSIEIGGRVVELRFAGTELCEPLTRAFSHVTASAGAPALTICVADTASTGVAPRIEARPRRVAAGALRCIFEPDSRVVHCFQPERKVAFFWAQAKDALKPWELAAPFRLLLGWWAETLGAQLAHGAVVGCESGGILLAGPSGSGKSTLTLACLRRGLCTLGDDYVWVEPANPHRAHSLYCTLKVSPRELGEPAESMEKTTLFLDAGREAELVSHVFPLRAAAALRIAGHSHPLVRRASAMEVLAALAPSSLLQLPGSGSGGLARLASLVRAMPTFVCEAGSDHARNAEAIAGLLVELASPSRTMPDLFRAESNQGLA